MKKRNIFILVFLILIISITPIFAKSPYKLSINENTYEEKEILDLNGIIYLPVRDVLERLNYIVTWDHSSKSVAAKNEDEVLSFSIDQNEVDSNGNKYNLKSKNILRGENTYSPVELFGKYTETIGSFNDKKKEFAFRNKKESDVIKSNDVDEISNKIDDYLLKNVKNKNFHGSVLVAKEDKILINKGYSFANLEHGIDNKEQTRFSIGSISKQFTSVSILKLYEDGKISLDDSLSKYLPEVINSENITIHNLLSHGSGLINFTDQVEYYTFDGKSDHYDDIVNLVNSKGINFNPGESFEYSNTNYLLLSKIVEKITNRTYEDYLVEEILRPIGMYDTGINYGKENEIQDATGYVGFLEVEVMDDELLQKTASGAGSMYSTVEDLYRWSKALDNNLILNEKTTELLFTRHNNMGSENINYGYGFIIVDTEKGPVYMHDGQTFGFSSIIVKYPKEDIVNIILVNNRLYDVSTIESDIKKLIDNKEVAYPAEIKEVKLEEKLINQLIGRYEFNEGMYLDITSKDGKIVGQITGQDPFDTIYLGDNKFIIKQADASMEFIFENNKVEKIIFNQLGIKLDIPRMKDDSKEKPIDIDYSKYIGSYKVTDELEIVITSEDNKIYAQLTNQPKVEIYYEKDNLFKYKIINATIEFNEIKNNQAQSLVLRQEDMIINGIKK